MQDLDLPTQLRLLGDPLRLRILALLSVQDLSVSDLVSALNLAQPRISTHLARLSEAGLVSSHREGRFLLYGLAAECRPLGSGLASRILQEFLDQPEAQTDRASLKNVLRAREIQTPVGTLGRAWVPGRTWESFARLLLKLLAPLRIADLGCGEGDMAMLLASAGASVVGVDHDETAIQRAQAEAKRQGCAELADFRVGDIKAAPIRRGEVDHVLISQVLHCVPDPGPLLAAAAKLLPRGGRLFVLDLKSHQESWVLDSPGHLCLGFDEAELRQLLLGAGLQDVDVQVASKDRRPPHFLSLLATGRKPL
jgi:ArsR family transcriptional regulator